MVWFNFLLNQGYFDPEKNPGPVEAMGGFQIPYWESLTYLEKLSLSIKEGKDAEAIDPLLNIIKEISEHPKDNYRTWYVLIKILVNIPNDRIPIQIFEHIPVWLSGIFNTNVQTAELWPSSTQVPGRKPEW